jgi:N-methylhydantoinase A
VRLRLAIDVGGTFTDAVALDGNGGIWTAKSLTSYPDPSNGVLDTFALLAAQLSVSVEELTGLVEILFHGTTVTTNAVLTGDVARTALLTTEGFRDSLEMRKGYRDAMYDNRFVAPSPLVPRYLRFGIQERTSYGGEVLTPVDRDSVSMAIEALREEEVEAIAISFLHAYAEEGNELVAEQQVRDAFPEIYVTRSSQLLPQIGFYERTSTTCINAAVGPLLSTYLRRLLDGLETAGFRGTLLVMQSNGGTMSTDLAREQACNSLMSGPAGGVVAARAFGILHGYERCLSMDMGGTSFDVCSIQDGAAVTTTGASIGPYRLAIPIVDIRTVGAGGGSIAWIDQGALLRVGPRSAGSIPGPACYGRGGVDPTVTDANVVLGYIDPATFWGGRMPLDAAAARTAIATRIAQPLGLSLEEAAYGIHHLVSVNMTAAARQITIERGEDPRDYILIVGGGAGPLHACALVRELGAAGALVPRLSPMLSAAGMLLSDIRQTFIRTLNLRFTSDVVPDVQDAFRDLIARAMEVLHQAGVQGADQGVILSADMRYAGQIHEIEVPLTESELEDGDVVSLVSRLHTMHDSLHGYSVADARIELVNVRVAGVGRTEKIDIAHAVEAPTSDGAPYTSRQVYMDAVGAVDAPVYDGRDMAIGQQVTGPSIIELAETSIVVDADFMLNCDSEGNFILRPADGEGVVRDQNVLGESAGG